MPTKVSHETEPTPETKPQHTAGPWSFKLVQVQTPCCGTVTSSVGYVKADTDHIEVAVLYGGKDQQEPNARLIAAAPDLLKALKALLTVLPENRDDDGAVITPYVVAAAEAALARAEGR